MKYLREDSFIADYARLSEGERDLFKAAVEIIGYSSSHDDGGRKGRVAGR